MVLLSIMTVFVALILLIKSCMILSEYLEKRFNWDYGICLYISVYGSIFFIVGLIIEIIRWSTQYLTLKQKVFSNYFFAYLCIKTNYYDMYLCN